MKNNFLLSENFENNIENSKNNLPDEVNNDNNE